MTSRVTLSPSLVRAYLSGELDGTALAAAVGCTHLTAMRALRRLGIDTAARKGRPLGARGRGPPSVETQAFGGRLRAKRQTAGRTQEEIAASSGLEASHLSELERGLHEPSWTTVCRLADALGCRTDDFR